MIKIPIKPPFDKKAMKKKFMEGWAAWHERNPECTEEQYAAWFMEQYIRGDYEKAKEKLKMVYEKLREKKIL